MESEELNMQMALAEVQIASYDLADFLIWTSQQGEEDDTECQEAFATILMFVYYYSRAKNQESAEETHAQVEVE